MMSWLGRAIGSAIAFTAVATAADPAFAMSGYKWKYRPLLIFAPSAGSAELARQKAIVASFRPAFQDRRIVVVYVVGGSVSAELGPGPEMEAAALRNRYGIAEADYRAVLVGKDGGVKLSSPGPIPARTLFGTIDAMPMRRDEKRKM